MKSVILVVLLVALGADDTAGSAEPSKIEPGPAEKAVESAIKVFSDLESVIKLLSDRPAAPKPSAQFDQELKNGVKLKVGEEAIDVEIGHAAPFVGDFDGDGRNDLLVGQFGGGKLRIYRNVAKDGPPQFDNFEFLQADGKDATVPFG